MKELKQVIIDELLERIQSSPFLLVVDYNGMTVPEFAELRATLRECDSKFHVAKNSFVKRAADSAEIPAQVTEFLAGQTAIVTGDKDVCAAAKAVQTYCKDKGRPEIRCGVLDGEFLDADQVAALAKLPAMEVLQAQLLGVLLSPGNKLATALNEPGASLARVLQAKSDQGE